MRDDVFGLSNFRSLNTGPVPIASPLPARSLPLPAGKATFENELSRATNARSRSAPRLKPYVSPIKQRSTTEQPASTLHKPTAPMTRSTTTTTSSTSLSRPPTGPDRSKHGTTSTTGLAKAEPPKTTDLSNLTGALPLGGYPHPDRDNGRGMHWVPTTKQTNATVDRFVAEAQRMGVKWVTFLNNGATVGDNDYLVSKLVGAGIEPVMRLYSPTLEPLKGDIESMVRHYVGMGMHYFQPFNEPNLNVENPDGKVSVKRYLDAWIPAAKAIVRGGGLPGFGSLAPGGDFDDQKFLGEALDGLRARGELKVLDRAWLSMHNYTWNHPIHDRGDGDGFFKFRAYHHIVEAALGRDLPIIGTEGGSLVGSQEDPRMPAVTGAMAADWTSQSFRYMRDEREPWLFASSVWTIADMAAGGSDPGFEPQALFKADGTQSLVVGAMQALG